jgi:hypothetical protein
MCSFHGFFIAQRRYNPSLFDPQLLLINNFFTTGTAHRHPRGAAPRQARTERKKERKKEKRRKTEKKEKRRKTEKKEKRRKTEKKEKRRKKGRKKKGRKKYRVHLVSFLHFIM